MIRKLLVTAALAASFAAPAFAATTYYVAQNAKTHKCSVTVHKPNGKTSMMVGTATFKTKAAATKALKADAVCKA
jgi:hypothetical protein